MSWRPASEVRAGDLIVLPSLGPREVVRVDAWVEETGPRSGERLTIVYRLVGGGRSWENKATEHGPSRSSQSEGSLRPLAPDDLVELEQ